MQRQPVSAGRGPTPAILALFPSLLITTCRLLSAERLHQRRRVLLQLGEGSFQPRPLVEGGLAEAPQFAVDGGGLGVQGRWSRFNLIGSPRVGGLLVGVDGVLCIVGCPSEDVQVALLRVQAVPQDIGEPLLVIEAPLRFVAAALRLAEAALHVVNIFLLIGLVLAGFVELVLPSVRLLPSIWLLPSVLVLLIHLRSLSVQRTSEQSLDAARDR